MSMGRSLLRLALALLLVTVAVWATIHRDQIDLAELDSWLGSLGLWAPVSYIVLYALGTVAFVPGVLFALAGGALFGPFWGSIWNLTGATLGATSIARTLHPRMVLRGSRSLDCIRSDRRSAWMGPSPARALSRIARTSATLFPKTLYTVSSDTPASAAILEIVVPENPSRTKRPVAAAMIAARRRCAAS